MFLITLTSFAQNTPEFEVYAGITNPKGISNLGYMVGLNLTPNLFQLDKDKDKGYRQWLNKMLFGIEFSGYKSGSNIIVLGTEETGDPITTVTTDTDECHCETEDFGYFTSSSSYNIIQDVKGVSLNFGVEVYKGWFITSGITAYNRDLIINGETVQTTRPIYIDGGIKKYFKFKKVFLSPTFKFNSNVTSFGLGFSYD